jgi:DNA-binding MarR family transcriptional regulator
MPAAIASQTRRAGHSQEGGVDPDLDAADGLIQLSRVVQDVHTRLSERYDLTPVQAKLICVLACGARGMAELAQLLGVEKAALTGLVDRAERRGLVERSPVEGDRRALRVTLTARGRRAAKAFHVAATERLDDLVSPLAPDEREQFRRALVKILAENARNW